MKTPFTYVPSQLSKRYGDIFGMHMGSMRVVMVNGMRLMKEVLVNQGDKFLDRPDIPIDEEVFSKIGELSLKICLSCKVQALTLQRSETAGDKEEPWRFFRPGWGSAMELFPLSWGSALAHRGCSSQD